MPATTVTMPQLGESVVEGTIVKWLAQPGQRVERDQPLVEIATDKANTEIPSPSAGVLLEVIAQEGAVVQVGAPLARLDDAAAGAGAQPPAAARPAQQQPAPSARPAEQAAPPPPQAYGSAPAAPPPPQAYRSAPAAPQQAQPGGNRHARASPRAPNLAQEHGVDLDRVRGSGPQGRITKADVMSYLDSGGVGPAAAGIVNPDGSADTPDPAGPPGAAGSQPPPPPTLPRAPRTPRPATL